MRTVYYELFTVTMWIKSHMTVYKTAVLLIWKNMVVDVLKDSLNIKVYENIVK